MSARSIVAELVWVAVVFGALAGYAAWQGDVSWRGVVTSTLIMYVASLVARAVTRRWDEASPDSSTDR